MKRTDLKALGLTDEQIQSIMDAYEKDIEKFKDDKAKITALEQQLQTSKTTIADLTEKAKNNVSQDDLKTQLENLKLNIKIKLMALIMITKLKLI